MSLAASGAVSSVQLSQSARIHKNSHKCGGDSVRPSADGAVAGTFSLYFLCVAFGAGKIAVDSAGTQKAIWRGVASPISTGCVRSGHIPLRAVHPKREFSHHTLAKFLDTPSYNFFQQKAISLSANCKIAVNGRKNLTRASDGRNPPGWGAR
jgi:hypothetical protein